ncbi:hypothetical protein B0T10DRAFT_493425 [Thelonectria olida]|uniref:DUF5071 domain-containing protein n=1 Tax=Thelonectria olida TaxID=1576542 RepID=A0A9P8VXT1_9HYPO|nr:hypothetical protein B0T10DRAFT_493425 [Thelonectria olida]
MTFIPHQSESNGLYLEQAHPNYHHCARKMDTGENTSSLIPEDHNDMSTIPAIKALDATEFGKLVPSLLKSVNTWLIRGHYTTSPFNEAARDVILSRATEPPTVTLLSEYLRPPFKDKDAGYRGNIVMYNFVTKLPLEGMEMYRSALERLASSDHVVDEAAKDFAFLKPNAAEALRFLNNPELIWVHTRKGDAMAARTLKERLDTPEKLRPLVPELLAWLADMNWPPHGACWAALAKFPEVTAGPIKELLEKERGDGGWLASVIEFVRDAVPLGELWEELRPQVQAIADKPTGDEDDWELADTASQWLKELDEWKGKQKIAK